MFVKIENGTPTDWGFGESVLRSLVSASLPERLTKDVIEPFGFGILRYTNRPAVNDGSEIHEVPPVLTVDGEWVQAWEVIPPSAEVAAQIFASAKISKNNQINTWRLEASRGTFEHGGKVFACDELSRSDIDGITSFVSLYGALPPGWPGAWKTKDNSFLPVTTVAGWKSFVASMVAQGNANFAKAQNLKAQLAAATTLAEVSAITW